MSPDENFTAKPRKLSITVIAYVRVTFYGRNDSVQRVVIVDKIVCPFIIINKRLYSDV